MVKPAKALDMEKQRRYGNAVLALLCAAAWPGAWWPVLALRAAAWPGAWWPVLALRAVAWPGAWWPVLALCAAASWCPVALVGAMRRRWLGAGALAGAVRRRWLGLVPLLVLCAAAG